MLNISIITLGDEICIGQIINTNASWIASECTKLGAKVITHSTIRDDRDNIVSEINRLIPVSDFVLITCGLGPTHDDITKNVLCDYFNDVLTLHEPTLQHLKKMFKFRGYELTDRNKEQAMMPSKSTALPNNVGTAPGMLFEKDGKYIISMPGVPAEMKHIMNNHVFQIIQNKIIELNDTIVLYKMLNTTGIPESKLADMIGEPDEFLNGATLAFLPSYRGVRLRIGVSDINFRNAKSKLEKIEKEIFKRAGYFIFATDEEYLISTVGKKLTQNKLTVSVAESCTGGLLSAEFTSISGSSLYFAGGVIAYSNEAKKKILKVNSNSLIKFGAVSEQVASELAINVRNLFNTDFGIGITGIAGPTGGTREKPLGTVFISIADKNSVIVKKYVFGNDRDINRERAVGTALAMLLNKLNDKGK